MPLRARSGKPRWSPEQNGACPDDQQEDDCESATYQPPKVRDYRATRNRHQVKLDGYEFVSSQGGIGRVGNQFQKRAPAGIAYDGHIFPGSFRLHVDQVSGLGNSDKRRIGRVT